MQTLALVDAKKRAHQIIDDIHMMHVPVPQIYQRLRKRLRCGKGYEHFAKMHSIEKVEKAIKHLEEMKAIQAKKYKHGKTL